MNSVPRSELVQAQEQLNVANRLVEEVRAKLKSRDAELESTQARLMEAEAHLARTDFLAEEFKKTSEFYAMQDEIWNDGIKWAQKRYSKRHPYVDGTFIQEDLATLAANPDAFASSDDSSGGRDHMDL